MNVYKAIKRSMIDWESTDEKISWWSFVSDSLALNSVTVEKTRVNIVGLAKFMNHCKWSGYWKLAKHRNARSFISSIFYS